MKEEKGKWRNEKIDRKKKKKKRKKQKERKYREIEREGYKETNKEIGFFCYDGE